MPRTDGDRLDRLEDTVAPLARGLESVQQTIEQVVTPALQAIAKQADDIRALQDEALTYRTTNRNVALVFSGLVALATIFLTWWGSR